MVILHKIPFDVVDQIVGVQRILLGRQFHMQRGKLVPRAVVVHHQVMHAQHAGVAHHSLLDVIHQVIAGAFAQQRAEGVHHQTPAGDQNEHGHAHTHQTIQNVPAGQAAQNGGNEHRTGAQHIVAAVRRRGNEGLGTDGASDGAVEAAHPQLDQNGSDQHGNGQQTELHRCGMQHLDHRLLQQGKANAQHRHADHQPGQILIPGMAEGVFRVRCSGRQFEPHQTDDIGRCIRQVVQGIGHDGDGTEQRAHGELAQAEQNIAHHAHDAGQIAIGGPGVRVLRIVGVTDKQTDQQLRHKKPPGQRWQPAYPMSLV